MDQESVTKKKQRIIETKAESTNLSNTTLAKNVSFLLKQSQTRF